VNEQDRALELLTRLRALIEDELFQAFPERMDFHSIKKKR